MHGGAGRYREEPADLEAAHGRGQQLGHLGDAGRYREI